MFSIDQKIDIVIIDIPNY